MPLDTMIIHIKDQYILTEKSRYRYVYIEIRKGIYGLPHTGILSNKLLKKILEKYGYYKAKHTPGLW